MNTTISRILFSSLLFSVPLTSLGQTSIDKDPRVLSAVYSEAVLSICEHSKPLSLVYGYTLRKQLESEINKKSKEDLDRFTDQALSKGIENFRSQKKEVIKSACLTLKVYQQQIIGDTSIFLKELMLELKNNNHNLSSIESNKGLILSELLAKSIEKIDPKSELAEDLFR